MSSNTPSALPSKIPSVSKSTNTSNQPSPAHSSQTNAFFATEGLGQRRSGSSSSGAANKSTSAPRNNQTSKSKHKQSRKFRLADEDALAESVSAFPCSLMA